MKKLTITIALLLLALDTSPLEARASAVRYNLKLTMTDSADPAKYDAHLTYTIVVTNAGQATADSVKVTDQLPANSSFVSASTTRGSCTGTTEVRCSVGSLAPWDTAEIKITILPGHQNAYDGSMTNSATAGATGKDQDLADNSDTEATQVVFGPITDLAVTLTGPPVIQQFGYASFVVTTHNLGPENVYGAWVTIDLPPGIHVVAAGPECWPAYGGGLHCRATPVSAAPFLVGESSGITLVVKPMDCGPQTLTASIAGGWDPKPENNSASATMHVEEAPALVGLPGEPVANLKVVAARPYSEDRGTSPVDDVNTTFSVLVQNTGKLTAEAVSVSTLLYPYPDVALTSFSTSQGTCSSSGASLDCELGDIPSLTSVNISLTVHTSQSAAVGIGSLAEARTPESGLSDNVSAVVALDRYYPPDPDRDDDKIPDALENVLCFVLRRQPTWCW